MILDKIFLQNFRNYPKSEFNFSPEINLIIGPNTAGKTNLLEAIYLLSTGKSFRAQQTKELVPWEEEVGRVKGFLGASETITLEVILTTGSVQNQKTSLKKYLVNGVARRQLDFVGNLPAVYFGPQDLEIVTDSPSVRREYLNLVLCQADREYRRALTIYEKALRQRNKILEGIKDERLSRSSLDYWDNLILENGPILTQRREEFVDFINSVSFGSEGLEHQFLLEYDKSVISRVRLEQYAVEEVAAEVTLVGPQRDDLEFKIYNAEFRIHANLANFGSRGEQRLATLWLKLGELAFLAQKLGTMPILLLDDIFSELDHEHREHVLKIIPQQQTIITTTDFHLIPESYQKQAKVIELEAD